MNRRRFVTLLGSLGLVPASKGFAQPSRKIPRIGYLVIAPLTDPPSAERAAFLKGLRDLGYVDGKNIIIEYRSAEGDRQVLPFLAEDLAESQVDLIVCVGEFPALAAKRVTRTVPIVMLFSPDPVGNGLVSSLARPGGNVTGMSQLAPELGAKRLELLKEVVPQARRIAVLRDSANRQYLSEWKSMQAAARMLDLTLQSHDIGIGKSIDAALATIAKHPPDALITIVDVFTAVYREVIPQFALRHRLPTMAGLRDYALNGGLMSYAPDFSDLSRRAATYVDRILRGARPADLPIEQPTQYGLVVNMRTAKTLRISIPESILARADEVIQ